MARYRAVKKIITNIKKKTYIWYVDYLNTPTFNINNINIIIFK